ERLALVVLARGHVLAAERAALHRRRRAARGRAGVERVLRRVRHARLVPAVLAGAAPAPARGTRRAGRRGALIVVARGHVLAAVGTGLLHGRRAARAA